MRPIEKKQAGDTVHYMDSHGQIVEHVIKEDYPVYGDAKLPLIGNIDRYCSYCEGLREVDALDVEHLAAKSKGGSETAWENFLLCCKICNSSKGIKVTNDLFHWPHLNNTFLSFIYLEDGRVKVNPDLPQLSRQKAKNLMELVSLHRFPHTENLPSPRDYRWRRRLETWTCADRYRHRYEEGELTADDIIEIAKITGNWSVWFTVFRGIDPVLQRLISNFPGTCASCFDESNHYAPIYRNPNNGDDPV